MCAPSLQTRIFAASSALFTPSPPSAQSWLKSEWIANSSVFNKLVALSNLAVYWQEGTEKHAPSTGRKEPPGCAFWVICPLSARAMISVNRGTPTEECPRLAVKVTCDEVKYTVDCSTLRGVASLLDAAVRQSNRENSVLDRPQAAYKGSARIWWRCDVPTARLCDSCTPGLRNHHHHRSLALKPPFLGTRSTARGRG